MLKNPLDPLALRAVQPAAPVPATAFPEVDPGSLTGQFRSSLPSAITRGGVYLVNQIAASRGSIDAQQEAIRLAKKGYSFDDQMGMKQDAQIKAEGADLTNQTAHMDDTEFNAMLERMQSLSSHPPTPEGYRQPTAPSLAQFAVGLGGALLMPKFASQALAAPFQAQIRQNSIDNENVGARNAFAAKTYDAQLDGTRAGLDAIQRRDANRATIAGANARNENTVAGANTRAATAAAVKIKLASLSATVRESIAKTVSGNAQLAQAVKFYAGAAPEDRPALAASFASQGLPLFGSFDDDVIESLAHLTPKEELANAQTKGVEAGTELKGAQKGLVVAKTATENQTREGKVRNLLATGDLLKARKEAENAQTAVRKLELKYLPQTLQATIHQKEAAATNARARANGAYGGMGGQGRGSAAAWEKTAFTLQDAYDKTQSTIEGVEARRKAIHAEGAALREDWKKIPEDAEDGDKQRKAINDRIRKLNDGLSDLDNIETEKRGYLKRVQAQIDEAKSKASAAVPSGGGPAPLPPSGAALKGTIGGGNTRLPVAPRGALSRKGQTFDFGDGVTVKVK